MDEKTCKMSVLLLAEGTVRIYKNKPFVTFTNTSDVLENLFKKLAKEMHYKVYKKSLKQWSIYSKPLAKRLLKECKSFRSKPCSSGLQNACPVVSGKLKTGASCYMCKPKTHNGKQYSPSTFPDSWLQTVACLIPICRTPAIRTPRVKKSLHNGGCPTVGGQPRKDPSGRGCCR